MIGLYVSVPIASFRRGAAREFWETYSQPPPSTVYGFLLSFVGETDRHQHLGVRVTAGLIGAPDRSSVLRRLWRIIDAKLGQGNGANVRPDYQQLLTDIRLNVWIDSSDEVQTGKIPSLEDRIRTALDPASRGTITRFGGLSLGESTHMVDEVSLIEKSRLEEDCQALTFLLSERGNVTFPVWVDHVGSSGTVFACGELQLIDSSGPSPARIPQVTNVRTPR